MPSAIYERWSVVVVPFPFTDIEVSKKRPALVLSPADFQERHGHLICGMITSAAHSDWPTDVTLMEYHAAGLHKPCKFRLKLFTLQDDMVLYRLGALADVDREAITQVIRALLPA
jgi:mRNA interferase MazF